MSAIGNIPTPVNEPIKSYAPGTPERAELTTAINQVGGTVTEFPKTPLI